ncbi:MAG: BBP7 family outer membrane beta-barrel protein [Pirellulaceae bacterium]|nr:BBP7 family outer membrane beta-barrel protein [Planctomycetales bacterium]
MHGRIQRDPQQPATGATTVFPHFRITTAALIAVMWACAANGQEASVVNDVVPNADAGAPLGQLIDPMPEILQRLPDAGDEYRVDPDSENRLIPVKQSWDQPVEVESCTNGLQTKRWHLPRVAVPKFQRPRWMSREHWQWSCNPAYAGLCSCDGAGQPLWVETDLLVGWLSGYNTPAMVTTSPAGTPGNVAGVLGQPTTSVIYGDELLGDRARLGARLRIGKWFDPEQIVGAQFDIFGLGDDSSGRTIVGDDSAILARPFFNTNPLVNGEDSQILQLPGLASGQIVADTSGSLLSIAPSMRYNLHCCEMSSQQFGRRFELLAGFRYLRLNDRLELRESLTAQGGGLVTPGTQFDLRDTFETTNNFYGSQLGLICTFQRHRWLLQSTSSLMLGYLDREATIDGETQVTVPGSPTSTRPGALLAQTTNMGQYDSGAAVIWPEFANNIYYQWNDHLWLTVGHTYFFMPQVWRSGAIIDRRVDGTLVSASPNPTATTPTFTPQGSPAWLHGLSIGATWRY